MKQNKKLENKIILLFADIHPTNGLQVSFSEQLQGNKHRGPYHPDGQEYLQFVPKNPMHSM